MVNEINTIVKLGKILRFVNIIKTALTVGIIAFTVFKIINIIRT